MAEDFSILVYSGLDLMGDGLMKLPFLRALRHAYPRAKITWLAGTGRTVYAGALAPLTRDLIDEVIENAGIGRSWHELPRRPLAHRRFDLVIDTQRRLKTTLVLRRIPHAVFISGTARYLLSDRKPPAWGGKKRRMVDNMLDLISAASGENAYKSGAPLTLDEKYTQAAAFALPGNGPYAGLAPGAGGILKRWPLERFIALAQGLAHQGLTPVFLLGPDEAGWLGALRAVLPEARFPLQDKGLESALRASPLFTIAVGRRLAAAVANDSGTGHMLAAADIPLVSLFGPTDPDKFAPCVSRGAVVRARDFGGAGMEAIPVEAVWETIDRLRGELY